MRRFRLDRMAQQCRQDRARASRTRSDDTHADADRFIPDLFAQMEPLLTSLPQIPQDTLIEYLEVYSQP